MYASDHVDGKKEIIKMRFSIFTHAKHKISNGDIYAYAPYVKEMNFWISKFEEIRVIAPFITEDINQIECAYNHPKIYLKELPVLHYKNLRKALSSLIATFPVLMEIFNEMKASDHIHIRCPGNIGLLACIIQIFFPTKPKTAKYAGNWDPESKQPLSYRLQKYILSNTVLTRNAKVLVYGKWPQQSRNIVPFFTASFSDSEWIRLSKDFTPPFKFVFVGSLVNGKKPLLAVKIIHTLLKKGFPVRMEIFGDGDCRKEILNYISDNDLEEYINLRGNQSSEILKKSYITSHFSILPSKSEGWPKAIAEAMFYGCIPIATRISCVPWMLDNGDRGILIDGYVRSSAKHILNVMDNQSKLELLSKNAADWSRNYTLERFRDEIHRLL
jgi:glycosyltransferase involved in cell wall biosynthesis